MVNTDDTAIPDDKEWTRCQIQPKTNWTYVFQVKDQIGTFSYFPSTRFHKAGGGYGPFSTPEAQFDLLIGDWYQRSFKDIRSELNNPYMAYDTPPDRIFINGKGPYGDPLMKSHESFNVTKGKTYLLRISNVGLELKQTLSTTKAGMQFMQMKFHEEMQNLVDQIEEGIITISAPSRHGKGHRSFNFNKVYGPCATQGEVFSDTRPLIRSVLDGYNVCIFAYGQTGSGKTYTMTGPKDLTEDTLGVNYRALSDLFLLAEQRKDTFQYDVSVPMIEIYNEQVRDLLVADGFSKRLEIRNSSQTGLNVPDASLLHVTKPSDVIDLMNVGQRNRAVGATTLNDRSSRSHRK
ncbi:hypothetical protein POM88_022757 [Heracleum sosnowskyi]|uniref:Kinesin motor domain-containing protein n=1 Tax=Heracleum sosnowskyi TaxID=360622 RepID=A0AAD8MU66_9APIA|nr:hypothetical protein POM88_022757 [Heracleum sosnowskyi]